MSAFSLSASHWAYDLKMIPDSPVSPALHSTSHIFLLIQQLSYSAFHVCSIAIILQEVFMISLFCLLLFLFLPAPVNYFLFIATRLPIACKMKCNHSKSSTAGLSQFFTLKLIILCVHGPQLSYKKTVFKMPHLCHCPTNVWGLLLLKPKLNLHIY